MGKLLEWSLKDLVEVVEGRVKNKFSAEIVIDGSRGLGKSSLSYKLLSRLQLRIPFKPRRDIVYTREDVLRHLSSKIQGCIFADEMVNVSYNRDFYQEDQKTLIKALNMYRDSGNVFIMCVPNFADLDVQIRELVSIRITVLRRGIALIQMPKSSLYTHDKWDVKYNQRIESKWSDTKTKNPRYSELTTVVGILKFGDLSPRQRAIYESIKKEKRNRVFGDYSDSALVGDPEKMFYNNLVDLMKQGKVTPEGLEMVCKVHGREITSVRKKLNKLLKETGDGKTSKDFILSDKKKERKDLLGLSTSS
ncbi:MAG TPA: hypothetical protein VKE88_01975 [Candidatus Nanoarchaeia archaeon]|nr:hypothetical protein [Candidatus Nanoarchaeia archaeon]